MPVPVRVTRRTFDQQWRLRFGNANPERLNYAFWNWMIRGEDLGELQRTPLEAMDRLRRFGGKSSVDDPTTVRAQFDLPRDPPEGPIWTFQRFGASVNELPDGRRVFIGGEHEDGGDPDFCIYNDVVVTGPGDSLTVYGYPEDVFPPTDFHSASLVGRNAILIGRLGYAGTRRPGVTPVMSLDLMDFSFRPMPSHGEAPGWLFEHTATVDDGHITIHGGKVVQESDERETIRGNFEDYAYDLSSGRWTRETHRFWRQIEACVENRSRLPLIQCILPKRLAHAELPSENRHEARIEVDGIPVWFRPEFRQVRIVIEGSLSEWAVQDLVDEVR